MTRYEKQIAEFTIEKLAERNIQFVEEDVWEYTDDGLEPTGRMSELMTSDHETFYDYDEALAHEIAWLKQEVEDEDN